LPGRQQGQKTHFITQDIISRQHDEAKKRALTAVGNSILKSVFHILSDKCEYKVLGAEYLISRTEAKRKAYLKSELSKLGYAVELKELPSIKKAG
jgi:predicted butyrate kinase (DUF1464 family)